jgi:hypothetical protein
MKMNNFNKLIALTTLAFSFACGVSPEMAADGLEALAVDESTCGYEGHQAAEEDLDIEKRFVPNGFGITSTYGCSISAQWPGLKCQIPFSKEFDMRVTSDGQDYAWNSYLGDALDSILFVTDDAGWNITEVVSGAPFQFRTSTTHPEGYLGAMQSREVETIPAGSQGSYLVHHRCMAVLYRTGIEANWAYQAASAAQKARYIRNLAKHEMWHCLGLPHSEGSSNTLMSQNYTFPGPFYDNPLTPTAAEQQRLEDFVP